MIEVAGDFELHLTGAAHQATDLATFAGRHGAGFVHIELDQGYTPSQPMLTVTGTGTLAEQLATAGLWRHRLEAAGLIVHRVKIEAAPWSAGVPQSGQDAAGQPAGRYFEHHVKVLLPAATNLPELTVLAEAHDARLSRNARRRHPDGRSERFVNQRCTGVGRTAATQRLDRLVAELRSAGYDVRTVEQEYVVHDDRMDLDRGWLETSPTTSRPRNAPPTYQPVDPAWGVRQPATFDPALKQYPDAFRAGEPQFASPSAGRRWLTARRAAMNHLLTVIGGTRWAGHLVLRGSVTMAAWVDGAREPGDLDFVVDPHTISSGSDEARELLDGIVAAVRATPGAGLQPDRTARSAIWTYERADGRRLVMPFTGPRAPDGSVQIDVVFGERLPVPPEPILLPGVGVPVLAATAGLSLAWKLLWLATDRYPQGKDLRLVRDLIRPELGAEADRFTAETVLSWDVDWPNFTGEYPDVTGDSRAWRQRLAGALARAWTPDAGGG